MKNKTFVDTCQHDSAATNCNHPVDNDAGSMGLNTNSLSSFIEAEHRKAETLLMGLQIREAYQENAIREAALPEKHVTSVDDDYSCMRILSGFVEERYFQDCDIETNYTYQIVQNMLDLKQSEPCFFPSACRDWSEFYNKFLKPYAVSEADFLKKVAMVEYFYQHGIQCTPDSWDRFIAYLTTDKEERPRLGINGIKVPRCRIKPPRRR